MIGAELRFDRSCRAPAGCRCCAGALVDRRRRALRARQQRLARLRGPVGATRRARSRGRGRQVRDGRQAGWSPPAAGGVTGFVLRRRRGCRRCPDGRVRPSGRIRRTAGRNASPSGARPSPDDPLRLLLCRQVAVADKSHDSGLPPSGSLPARLLRAASVSGRLVEAIVEFVCGPIRRFSAQEPPAVSSGGGAGTWTARNLGAAPRRRGTSGRVGVCPTAAWACLNEGGLLSLPLR